MSLEIHPEWQAEPDDSESPEGWFARLARRILRRFSL